MISGPTKRAAEDLNTMAESPPRTTNHKNSTTTPSPEETAKWEDATSGGIEEMKTDDAAESDDDEDYYSAPNPNDTPTQNPIITTPEDQINAFDAAEKGPAALQDALEQLRRVILKNGIDSESL
jgi:hypothetical protein